MYSSLFTLPAKELTAKDFQGPNKELLDAIRKHLGGTLPADRYTFLYYFADMSAKAQEVQLS
ncbi:MAG: hypothetical protein IPG02_17670 [Ignavibacteria bacterium]|nr:hypothetical protein [Ignavibacteria bacterium]